MAATTHQSSTSTPVRVERHHLYWRTFGVVRLALITYADGTQVWRVPARRPDVPLTELVAWAEYRLRKHAAHAQRHHDDSEWFADHAACLGY